MPTVTIRKVTGQEKALAVYHTAVYAYGATPPMPEREKWIAENLKDGEERCLAVYEDDRPAAVLFYTPMKQNVRGKITWMGAVAGVASAPETRRKGYVRQGLTAAYAEMRAEGIPVSGLYPFRESFYERLGYVSFTCPVQVKLPTSALAPLLKQDLGGSVERIPALEGLDVYRAYLQAMRERVHGMAVADGELEEKLQDSHTWMLLVRESDQVTGIMLYRIVEEARWKKVFDVRRFYYTTPLARARLLEWIARHVDQVEKAEIFLPPWEQPQLWMVDLKPALEFSLAHPPMGRVIDLSGLNDIPAGEGSFTVQVKDPYCPWNEGVWRFASAGGALVVSCGGSADGAVSIQGLSAWLYGSIDPADFALRGWGNLSPEVIAAMRAMLPPRPAYMHEFY